MINLSKARLLLEAVVAFANQDRPDMDQILLLDTSYWALRVINLDIPVLVRSLKSSDIDLGQYLDWRLIHGLTRYRCHSKGTYSGRLNNPCLTQVRKMSI